MVPYQVRSTKTVFVIHQAYSSLSVPDLVQTQLGVARCGFGVTGATWSW